MNGDWEYYYPGVYDEEDRRVLQNFWDRLEQVNNKSEVNINDLITGKLDGKPWVSRLPMEHHFKITPENMREQAYTYAGNNPLFNNRDYARKTKYGDLIAFPLVLTLEVMPAMPKAEGIGDYMVVSEHNDTITFYHPIYEGDTLFTIYDEQHCYDITPPSGSYYRTFAMAGKGRTFNQRGELVAEGANILRESFRRHKDPAKRSKSKAHAWESPDWWSRPRHIYTDKDWEFITGLWKQEKVRGPEVLYWDDVNIGDELTPFATPPILVEEELDMTFNVPVWCTDIKKNMLKPTSLAKMVKNSQGIYVMPEYSRKKPRKPVPGQEGATTTGGSTRELANRDGRAVVQNAVLSKFAAGMLLNWMGDAGWLQRMGWDIMALPPGYDHSVIPPIPREYWPELFDKFPYMEKVPYMRGCRAAWHALEGDVIIIYAYVTDKYQKNGDYFVDLTWWCQTIDKFLVEEGFATVKLPKR